MKKITFIIGLSLMTIISYSQDIFKKSYLHYTDKVEVEGTNSSWTASGYHIASGDKISIVANGFVKYNSNINYCNPTGLGVLGKSSYVSEDFPQVALLGKIGESGTPFLVGEEITFDANVSGELFLIVNEYIFSDNDGEFVAFIFKNEVSDNTSSTMTTESINSFVIYPNPSQNLINIDFEDFGRKATVLEVFDVQGKKLYYNDVLHTKITIDISDFPVGTYIAKLKDNDGIIMGTSRFIKN
ncbi:LecA/PA-IL family lectin [Maribellus maritimus]|uniref:LecA/PA-IL family lectin n=1 Tax=Maribellus maritimus TaxID=2870838 RepID=UPI001EEC7385|nr:LecA/PA-IL family lectin [Maribellus maritimus]MCG6187450.1 T9SS type A sorting domain-containing protein [Maribellus maritimus]